MNGMVAGMLAGLAVLCTLGGASAQENVTIGGIEATRVVIAPPQTALARTIKAGLSSAYYSQRSGTRAYDDAQKLYFFYGARHFEPLWLTEDAGGKIAYSENAEKIIGVFRKAYLSGLEPADYLTADIDLGKAGVGPDDMARLETAFSAAALRYAQDAYGGRLDPRAVSGYITIRPPRLDEAETLMQLTAAADPAEFLHSLEPVHREYVALKSALAKFYDGTAEEPVVIPDGRTLRPGMADSRVPLMRERLGLTAPEDAGLADIYDDALVAAIEEFQEDLGLVVDGITGPATVAALNGGSATSKGDILANMERWRWMPRDLGDFNVMVNVPEFRLAVTQNGEVVHTTRVVVGKPSNQTPIFSDEIEHIVVNPYWNVPSSIAVNEIAPQLQVNPGYIAHNNMELLYGGQVIDAASVDWSATSVEQFRIRQRPGAGNALGSVKFLFPNQHDVYLHDTPSKYLFDRSYRAFSHGCVRVQNPWEFAQALLREEPKVTLAGLEAQRGGNERWNNLGRHVPVHITYFTLRVDADGAIRSYGDVYGHNAKIKALLGV